MKKAFCVSFLLFSVLLCSFSASSQASITGPNCVIAGTEYQYNLTGSLSNDAQLCITGGKIVGSTSNCVLNLTAAFVRIVWKDNKGTIKLVTEQGDASTQVTVIDPLVAGNISGNSKKQFVEYDTAPLNVVCGPASGGNCTPTYLFQWQHSEDNLIWKDVSGATGQSLNNMPALLQTTFYRRKTTETKSGSIAYSDEAVVYVAADAKGR